MLPSDHVIRTVWTSLPSTTFRNKESRKRNLDTIITNTPTTTCISDPASISRINGRSRIAGSGPRPVVAVACQSCHGHKVRCDGNRPCERCTRLGRADKCQDRIWGAPRIPNQAAQQLRVPDAVAVSSSPSPSLSDEITIGDFTILSPSTSQLLALDLDSKSALELTSEAESALPLSPFPFALPLSPLPTLPALPTLSTDTDTPQELCCSPILKRGRLLVARDEDVSSIASTSSFSTDSIASIAALEVGEIAFPATVAPCAWQPPSLYSLCQDERSVIRSALHKLVPWIQDTIARYLTVEVLRGPEWKKVRALMQNPMCPSCISPSRCCSWCVALARTEDTSPEYYASWMMSAFFATRWRSSARMMLDRSELFEQLPIAGMVCSVEPATRPSSLSLVAEHHRAQLTTLFAAYASHSPSSSSSSPSSSLTVSLSASECSTSSAPSRLLSSLPAGSAPQAEDSRVPDGPKIRLVTINDELERLLGYSREEFRQQLQSVGWKADLRFVNAEEASEFIRLQHQCTTGAIPQFSIVAHVLTKWNAVLRVLIWSRCWRMNGYRTTAVFLVPNPTTPAITSAN